ncbi:MAG: S49 family peptidase [Aquabacterium sp.]
MSLLSFLLRRKAQPSSADEVLPRASGGVDAVQTPESVLAGLITATLADRASDRTAKEKDRRASNFRAFLYFMMFGAPALFYLFLYFGVSGWKPTWSSDPVVGVIRLEGPIASGTSASAEKIIPVLTKAFETDSIKAIVIAVDSPGGAPVESERIYRAMALLRAKHNKPVVSVINSFGASAAYMVALHTDKIYAGRYSMVGSVGAVMEGWDFHKVLEKVDVSRRVYASGEYKSMLNPYVPMSAGADKELQALVAQMGQQFEAELRAARAKHLKPGVNYASGQPWGGVVAKDIGLVDEVGTLEEVVTKTWDLPMKDLGPREHGLSFMSASSEWLADVFSKTWLNIQSASATPTLR